MGALVVITTVGTEEQAVEIAEELLGRRHAACVNILRVPRTIYRWKGKVCRDSEFMLVIKTAAEEYSQVESTIQELHQYELPEVLAFEVSRISAEFLPWIMSSLDKDADFVDDEEEDGEGGADSAEGAD